MRRGEIAIISGVGMHEVKMFNPVRPGDTLSVKARWSKLRKSDSKPDRGFSSILCNVHNQRKELVMSCGYRYRIACRDFEMPAEDT